MRAIGIRLEGPMQAWGGPTAGDDRPTLEFPTKSGVLGLVAGALGIDRSDTSSLLALHRGFGVAVRVDRAGVRGLDFHTVQQVPTAEGGVAETVVSRRSYLYDASFAVLLMEVEASRPLKDVVDALRCPYFVSALGRKGCPPAVPVLAAPAPVEGANWRELFSRLPIAESGKGAEEQLDVFVEGRHPGRLRELRVRDQFVGPLRRMFGERSVSHFRIPRPATVGDTVDPWFPS
jgi:CRISPR system Cascade subunit CasD